MSDPEVVNPIFALHVWSPALISTSQILILMHALNVMGNFCWSRGQRTWFKLSWSLSWNQAFILDSTVPRNPPFGEIHGIATKKNICHFSKNRWSLVCFLRLVAVLLLRKGIFQYIISMPGQAGQTSFIFIKISLANTIPPSRHVF